MLICTIFYLPGHRRRGTVFGRLHLFVCQITGKRCSYAVQITDRIYLQWLTYMTPLDFGQNWHKIHIAIKHAAKYWMPQYRPTVECRHLAKNGEIRCGLFSVYFSLFSVWSRVVDKAGYHSTSERSSRCCILRVPYRKQTVGYQNCW